MQQNRYNQNGQQMDGLTYRYATDINNKTVQNRLYHVNDTPGFTSLMPDDIDDQGVFNSSLGTINTLNNYGYDELGNLVRDNQEQIASIGWNAYGKMTGYGVRLAVQGRTWILYMTRWVTV